MTNLLTAVRQNLQTELPESSVQELDLAVVAVNFKNSFGIGFDEFKRMKLCTFWKLSRLFSEMKSGGSS